MQERNAQSLKADVFEAKYQKSIDPWNYEHSAYEKEKYDETLRTLPHLRYRRSLDIGCSIGILTQQLSLRCEQVVAIDCSSLALAQAQQRCKEQQNILFQQMVLPIDFPDGLFDLMLLSEVGYYWSAGDLERTKERMLDHLEPGGHLLLIHWTLYSKDHRVSGDEVHETFLCEQGDRLVNIDEKQVRSYNNRYRINLFERLKGKSATVELH